jgi:hypothetical protein
MVAMMDVDRSGKLGLEEFKLLWLDVRNWRVNINKSLTNKTVIIDRI